MRKAVIKTAEIRREPGRRLVTWLLLLAFTLQSFVTQTHFHTLHATAGITLGKVLQRASGPDKSPLQKDNSACPFCQAVIHAGAFLSPSAPLLLLLVDRAEGVVPWLITTAAASPSAHSWQSRAPPQH